MRILLIEDDSGTALSIELMRGLNGGGTAREIPTISRRQSKW
jgi:hypothetical protein